MSHLVCGHLVNVPNDELSQKLALVMGLDKVEFFSHSSSAEAFLYALPAKVIRQSHISAVEVYVKLKRQAAESGGQFEHAYLDLVSGLADSLCIVYGMFV